MRVFPVVRGSFFGVLRCADALLDEGQQFFQGDGKSRRASLASQPAMRNGCWLAAVREAIRRSVSRDFRDAGLQSGHPVADRMRCVEPREALRVRINEQARAAVILETPGCEKAGVSRPRVNPRGDDPQMAALINPLCEHGWHRRARLPGGARDKRAGVANSASAGARSGARAGPGVRGWLQAQPERRCLRSEQRARQARQVRWQVRQGRPLSRQQAEPQAARW